MRSRRTWIALALGTAGSLVVLWGTNVPLGIPGEWTWNRVPFEPREWTALVFSALSAAIVGGLYVALVAVGAKRLDEATPAARCAWLGGLCVGAFAWLWAVQESPARVEFGMAKSAFVLYYRGPDGYFDEARYVMRDVRSYLAGYEARMAEGDVLHLGTHPPGLMLFHHACINAVSASPALRDVLIRTQASSFRAAFDEIEANADPRTRPVSAADRAAVWLAALLMQLAAAAAVVPLYLLVRRDHGRAASWWTASLWPLVPALAIFLPKSDAFFPFLGALFLWFWLEGFRRGSAPLCILAGVTLATAMLMSLAILPVAMAAGLLTVWEAFVCLPIEQTSRRLKEWATRIGSAFAGWAFPVLVVGLVGNVNLPSVWLWNYRNHAAFYAHYSRTYWKWLLANPVELVFAIGVPLAVTAAIGFRSSLAGGWRRKAAGPCWCLTATWLVLWLTGKNMGEAARLWLIVMPWPVWLTAGFFAEAVRPVNADAKAPLWPRIAILLLLLQMAVAVATVTRVTGFDFSGG